MPLATASTVLDLVSILVWGAVMVKGFNMADKGYGGKFTSVYPSLIGAFSLFFLLGIVEWTHNELFVKGLGAESDMFVFGMKGLQLVAGILLANAIRKIYDINFATTGFMGVNDE